MIYDVKQLLIPLDCVFSPAYPIKKNAKNHSTLRFITLSLMLFCILLFACNNKTPIDTNPKSNILKRIDSLDRLAYDYTYINIDTAILYADSALLLSKENNYQKGIAKALRNKAIMAKNTGDEHSENYLLEAIKIGGKIRDTSLMSSTYSILGQLYGRAGNKQDEAVVAYLTSLELAEKINHKELIGAAFNNLGNLSIEIEDYEQAFEYFQKALDFNKAMNAKNGVIVTLSNFASTYSAQGNPQKAVTYYKEAIKITKEMNNKRYQAALINNIAFEYENTGKLDSALVYYKQAAAQFDDINDLYGIALSKGNIAGIYLAQKKADLTIATTKEFMNFAKQVKAQKEIVRSHKFMSEALALKNNYEKAYKQRLIYDTLSDSIFNVDKNNIISELQLKYETEKKDAELLAKKVKINKQRHWVITFIIIAIIFLIAVVIIGYLYRLKQKAYKHLLISYENQMKCMNDKIGSLNKIKLNDAEKEKLVQSINQKLIKDKVFCLQGIDINHCADMLNTNRSYLSHVINDVFQKSFTDFINELRIKEACEKLKSEKNITHTLEAIAESVGYSSRNTFTRNFKKTTGVTPSYYIDNYLK